MSPVASTMLTIGLLFLAGLCADLVGRRTGMPRVTLLLVFGLLAGPHGTGIFPEIDAETTHLVSSVTLALVAFLLGASFRRSTLTNSGGNIFGLSGIIACSTAVVVFILAWLLGVPLLLALLLGTIATATDPIAIRDVVNGARNAKNNSFCNRLLGIVAIDDAWGIVIFSAVLGLAQALSGNGALSPILQGLWEVGGAVLLGILIGAPMAYLSGRIAPGEPSLVEAIGFVLLCAGIAEHLQVSMLLSAMVMGTITANFSHHHQRPFHAIEGVEWPMMIAFFFLTGATIYIENLNSIFLITIIYCATRILGRLLGGWLGASWVACPPGERAWYGSALLPQAGVALGMTLVASQIFPDIAHTLLPAIVISTVFFELVGPLLASYSIKQVSE